MPLHFYPPPPTPELIALPRHREGEKINAVEGGEDLAFYLWPPFFMSRTGDGIKVAGLFCVFLFGYMSMIEPYL